MFESNFQRVVELLLTDLGGPKACEILSHIRSNRFDRIAAMAIDPANYGDPDTFFRDYQAVELLRKLDIPGNKDALEEKAVETFFQCEADCLRTNIRLEPMVNNYYEAPSLIPFIEVCKDFIRDVLGPIPNEFVPSFGKGATYGDRGSFTTIPDKMSDCPTVTSEAYSVVSQMFERTAWSRAMWEVNSDWAPRAPDFVRGNRFTTVPKDTVKRRGICVEPSLNVSYQLAVGKHLKKRVRTVTGIDLSGSPNESVKTVGQLLHMELAKQASLNGELATVDLSNASDTVSYELVKLLLPSDWFQLLCSLRSAFTLIKGKWVKLEKFSSMGNGFTFELETIIFMALIRGCGGNIGVDSFVYGDDIITPIETATKLLPVLKFFGFTPNKKKTFLTGNFRESCGGDYFLGKAVRPHYIKEIPHEPQDWIKLANGLRRVGLTDPNDVVRWYRFKRAWFSALSNLPTHIRRLRGPDWLGDLVIHDDTTPGILGDDGIWRWRVYAPIPYHIPWKHFRPSVTLAAALLGVPSEGPTPRNSVSGYSIRLAPPLMR